MHPKESEGVLFKLAHLHKYSVFTHDTTNISVELATNGEPTEVNVPEVNHELLKDGYSCKLRGRIIAKNIGRVVYL